MTEVEEDGAYLLCNLVNLMIKEVALVVKMCGPKSSSPHNPVWNTSTSFHDQTKHLVIGLSREHYPSSIKFIEAHSS